MYQETQIVAECDTFSNIRCALRNTFLGTKMWERSRGPNNCFSILSKLFYLSHYYYYFIYVAECDTFSNIRCALRNNIKYNLIVII